MHALDLVIHKSTLFHASIQHKMTHPLVVSLPHSLGKAEAIRRLKAGLTRASADYSQFIDITEESWTGDRLLLQITALTQHIRGQIDVGEDRVRIEILLPWILAGIAKGLRPLIEQKGTLMLTSKR
jgi:hypothetical protein